MRTYRYPSRTAAIARLRTLSERITRLVCSVSAPAPTRAEMDEIGQLRAALGLNWDTINQRWRAWTPEAE